MSMANVPTLNTLWIGNELHFVHQLCLRSALHCGHSVRLFCYDEVRGVPDGVKVAAADDIIPRHQMFRHRATGSPAPFADRFRIKLIAMGLGMWIDTDILFVRPLTATTPNVFGWEEENLIGNAILGLDEKSPAFAALSRHIDDDYLLPPWWPWHRRLALQARRQLGFPRHVSELPYGTTGPDLLTWWIGSAGLTGLAQPIETFYALPYRQKFEVFKTKSSWHSLGDLPETVVAVHLWFQGLVGGIGSTSKDHADIPQIEPGSFLDDCARRIGLC